MFSMIGKYCNLKKLTLKLYHVFNLQLYQKHRKECNKNIKSAKTFNMFMSEK